MPFLGPLCEGGGPAGPEGENLTITRNISDFREALSPTACGRSPLAEGAKKKAPVLFWAGAFSVHKVVITP